MRINWKIDFAFSLGVVTFEGLEFDDSIYIYWSGKDGGKSELVDEIPRQKLTAAISQMGSFIEVIEASEDMEEE